jgi:hypothetical protein
MPSEEGLANNSCVRSPFNFMTLLAQNLRLLAPNLPVQKQLLQFVLLRYLDCNLGHLMTQLRFLNQLTPGLKLTLNPLKHEALTGLLQEFALLNPLLLIDDHHFKALPQLLPQLMIKP